MSNTTIPVTKKTKQKLSDLKNHPHETYEQLFIRLFLKIEDDNTLSKQELSEIKKSISEIEKGQFKTQNQMKKKYGLK